MNLVGKTILITGSTDGVGRAVALALAAAGARVLVHGRNRQRGERVLAAMREAGNATGAFYPADLASLAAVRELAATIRREHQRPARRRVSSTWRRPASRRSTSTTSC